VQYEHSLPEQIDDPAARRVIAALRRQLDQVTVLADHEAARRAEVSLLRRRIEAILAARQAEVAGLERRIAELGDGSAARNTLRSLEAEVASLSAQRDAAAASARLLRSEVERLTAGAEARAGLGPEIVAEIVTTGGDGGHAHPREAFERRLRERSTDLEHRFSARLAEQRRALEEKEARIRDLASLVEDGAGERIRTLEQEVARLRAELEGPRLDPEDLEVIDGIGPAIAATLRSLGIASIRQVAALDDAALAEIDEALGAFRGRAVRDRWVQQARDLLDRLA